MKSTAMDNTQSEIDCDASFSNGGHDGTIALKKIVQALARQQAQADHEAAKQH